MALNWLEEVVSQWYKLRGYIVIENEDFPTPKGKGGRAEADIIAFDKKELVQVECKTYWGTSSKEKELQQLRQKFQLVQEQIFDRYKFLKQYKSIKKTVVTGRADNPRPIGPWSRLQAFCKKEKIELIEINTIIEELIRELRHEYPKSKGIVGKKEGIARFLIHLTHNHFLKRPQK